jgi:hypothetical protein
LGIGNCYCCLAIAAAAAEFGNFHPGKRGRQQKREKGEKKIKEKVRTGRVNASGLPVQALTVPNRPKCNKVYVK